MEHDRPAFAPLTTVAVVDPAAGVAVREADATVVDNVEHSRFDLSVDGTVVGILGYRDGDDNSMTLMHTVVKEQYGDHGWAAVLVREALDTLRDNDIRIIPQCTYVQRFLAANPEYLDMIAADLVPEDQPHSIN